jgi:hypothetical protein
MGRRPTFTSLVLMMVIVVAGGMNSLQDLAETAEKRCEYCKTASSPPAWLPPAGFVLPSILLDSAPQAFLPLLFPGIALPQRDAARQENAS